jgi:hypothetical protein
MDAGRATYNTTRPFRPGRSEPKPLTAVTGQSALIHRVRGRRSQGLALCPVRSWGARDAADKFMVKGYLKGEC